MEATSIVLRHRPCGPDPTLPILSVMLPVGGRDEDENGQVHGEPMKGQVALAATMARFAVTLYGQQNYTPEAVVRLFGTCFVAAGALAPHIRPVNNDNVPLGVEYLIDMHYEYDVTSVGDRVIGVPTVRLTAYKPLSAKVAAGDATEDVLAWPSDCIEKGAMMGSGDYRDLMVGTLTLTVAHGMLVVSDAAGWFDEDVVAHLKDKYNAARS